jgi:hypothetical protein
MEQIYDQSHDNGTLTVADRSQRTVDTDRWLNEHVGFELGRLLRTEIEILDAQLEMLDPEDCLDIVEHYFTTRPDKFDLLWSLPFVQRRLDYLAQKGNPPRTRKRVQALQKSRLSDARGRPHGDPEESRDFIIATQVEDAVVHLTPGWNYVRDNKSEGRRQLREELIARGYYGEDASVLVEGRHRKIRGAAVSLVAKRLGRPEESINSQASRGSRK